VRTLANKIAAAAGTTQSLSVDVRNISSLDPSDASAVRQALEAELTQRHFRLMSPGSAQPSGTAAQVHVTFSEGVEGLVWVAEILTGNGSEDDRQVAIVAVAKPANDIARDAKDSLILDKKLIWEQPDAFLDFALLPPSAGINSTLLILEPGRLVFYRSLDSQSVAQSGAQWQLWQSATIAHPSPRPRDESGQIDLAAQRVISSDVVCAGDFQQPQTMKCAPSNRLPGVRKAEIPGHEESEMADLATKCSEGNVVLGTGNGDWTQPDSIQGFELANPQAQPVASGEPIGMDGPIISISASPNVSDARAVVHNLKSGPYEGYIVTATCNH